MQRAWGAGLASVWPRDKEGPRIPEGLSTTSLSVRLVDGSQRGNIHTATVHVNRQLSKLDFKIMACYNAQEEKHKISTRDSKTLEGDWKYSFHLLADKMGQTALRRRLPPA